MAHPRLQTRDGGPFYNTHGPTLAANASRWAVLLDIGPTDPPSLQTRAGGLFLLNETPTDPPLLQTQVGGSILLYFITHGPPSTHL